MSDTAARLASYKAAEARILKGQSYNHNGRQLTLADLAEVRKAITELEAQLARETAGAAGVIGPRVLVAGLDKGLG